MLGHRLLLRTALLSTLVASAMACEAAPSPGVAEPQPEPPRPDVPELETPPTPPVVQVPETPTPTPTPTPSTPRLPFWSSPLDDTDVDVLATKSDACLRLPASATPSEALHVVDVSQPHREIWEDATRVPRPVSVRVEGSAPVTLALWNYDPTTWTITLAPGASVKKVVVDAMYDGETSVTGLPSSVPVTVRAWQPWKNVSSASDYEKRIAAVRAEHATYETTYQTFGTAKTVVVGATSGTPAWRYDLRAPCADACGVPTATLGWTSPFPAATVSSAPSDPTGRTATFTASYGGTTLPGVWLRTTRGARCGRHFVEIETSGPAGVGLITATDVIGRPDITALTDVPAGSRVGVAVDFETRKVRVAWRTASGTIERAESDLPLWRRDALYPGVRAMHGATGTARLVPPAEHLFEAPADYASDLGM